MMGRPSIIPQVLARLDAYLEAQQVAYLMQPEGQQTPTLPATPDGKINVRAVAQAVGLKVTQEKYLYERDELSQIINLMAEGQGLLPIGSRLTQTAGDQALKERMARQAQGAKAASQAAVEAQAVHAELLQKLREALDDNEMLRSENLRLRAQLDTVHTGMFVRVDD